MIHCGESALWGKSVRVCVLVGRCGENTHIRINDTLWGKCIVGKICAFLLVIVGKIHTYVQIIHCGENLCVLVGRCGEKTHIRTNDTLWGKCIVGKICAS